MKTMTFAGASPSKVGRFPSKQPSKSARYLLPAFSFVRLHKLNTLFPERPRCRQKEAAPSVQIGLLSQFPNGNAIPTQKHTRLRKTMTFPSAPPSKVGKFDKKTSKNALFAVRRLFSTKSHKLKNHRFEAQRQASS